MHVLYGVDLREQNFDPDAFSILTMPKCSLAVINTELKPRIIYLETIIPFVHPS